VCYDKHHGGSQFGGVDFYYPIRNLHIEGDSEAGVKSYNLDTFCELDSRQYSVIMQNGWDLKPEITSIKVSQGEDCVLTPKFKPSIRTYSVECGGAASETARFSIGAEHPIAHRLRSRWMAAHFIASRKKALACDSDHKALRR
jgi:hypothetical protein